MFYYNKSALSISFRHINRSSKYGNMQKTYLKIPSNKKQSMYSSKL